MKNYFFFFLLIFSFFAANAQESKTKITLKTGAVFIGEVILKNDELIMLKDNTGARFQFSVSEIDKIEITSAEPTSTIKPENTATSQNKNLCFQLELSTGNAWARKAFGSTSVNEAMLAFGNRKMAGNDFFVGFGVGYFQIADANLSFTPLSLKIQTYTSKNRTSPFVGFESGYAFSTSKNYSGGPFAKISLGINHRLNYKSAVYAGVSAGVYSINGQLTETTQNGNFTFVGTTTCNVLGLKVGFQF